jgi:ubiquitin-protein ligase
MFELVFNKNNLFHQKLLIHGPPKTPYEGGVFEVDLVCSLNFEDDF